MARQLEPSSFISPLNSADASHQMLLTIPRLHHKDKLSPSASVCLNRLRGTISHRCQGTKPSFFHTCDWHRLDDSARITGILCGPLFTDHGSWLNIYIFILFLRVICLYNLSEQILSYFMWEDGWSQRVWHFNQSEHTMPVVTVKAHKGHSGLQESDCWIRTT